eukprot:TRINITY_DN11172_c0_g1_i1.p1 TRINITY_DN11172_c0_g1~~TRINITY_DN11172_c0_g1_i1.p1  ORF type:complete len:462 (-),score=111.47 TRINITY_DN11172_c0_g1_i1:38-1423(-)
MMNLPDEYREGLSDSQIEQMRENSASITKLDLRYNDLSQDQLNAIFRSLADNQVLKHLVISGNPLTMNNVELLSENLIQNLSLETIEIRNCDLDDDAAGVLIYALKTREITLKRFIFGSNNISEAVSRKLRSLVETSDEPPVNDSSTDSESSDSEKVSVTSFPSVNSERGESTSSSTAQMPFQHVILLREIYVGGGSGAVVYEGLVDGWRCAVKQLEIVDIHECNNFLAEMEMLESLPYHPNIVRYLYHDVKGRYLRLFVTQYHVSLRQVIKRRLQYIENGREDYWSESQVCGYMLELVSGLNFLHEQNVLHRDLKSHNIFVMLDSHNNITQLAIGDFDSAKKVSAHTMAKTYVGTPDYMAPEVVSQTGSYSKKVDIWSLGMLLFELITLHRPYHDVNFYLVPELIKMGKRPNMNKVGLQYQYLSDIWLKCTERKPEKRPSLESLRDEFREIKELTEEMEF